MASTIVSIDFKPDSAGIGAILTSLEAQAAVGEIAQQFCDQANAACISQRTSDWREVEPFHSGVDVGHHTSFGWVAPKTTEGIEFENETHILESMNH